MTISDSPRGPINLDRFRRLSDLELLSGKQLKELLSRNRVEFRGCLERRDLLERAKMLWRDHAKFRDREFTEPIFQARLRETKNIEAEL